MRFIFFVAFICFAAFLPAQSGLMTPEILWKLGRVGLEDIAPDGKSAVYGITRYNIEENKSSRDLYLIDLTGKRTRLTSGSGSEHSAVFSRKRDKIYYVSGGQYYSISRQGGEPVQLSNIEDGVANAKLMELNDGRLALLFTKKVKMEQTTADLYPNLPQAEALIIDDLMYRHWDSWSDAYYNHLCVAFVKPGETSITQYRDLMEGEAFDSPLNPFGGSESFTISPDGNTVIYEAKKLSGKEWAESTNSDLYMVDLRSGETTNLTADFKGYDKDPQFSPDGSRLAWMSMQTPGYESDVNDLIIRDMKSGQILKVLKASGKYDAMTFQSYRWKDANSLLAGVPMAGSNQIFHLSLPAKLSEGKNLKMQQLSSGDHNYNHFEVAGNSVIVERQDINNATELYHIDLASKNSIRKLSDVNDEIYAGLRRGKVEKRMVKTSDGKEMLTWVIYPPDFDPNKKYPAILYCQGGPQSQVSQFYSFRWNFQLMAAKGYIVVAPNRRGLPGFGREWNEQISGDWGGQAMRDYLAAIDDVKKESYVDEERLGCVGASYGGYSVYYLAGIHENRFKAFISHCGLFDLESWYLTTEELFFANQDLGGPYWKEENAETFSTYDPKEYVQNWNTPILVIHGGKDFRVPENQGMEAFQAAKLMGVPTRFLYFPNEGHWVLSPQNGLIWHDQFFGWLDKWLK